MHKVISGLLASLLWAQAAFAIGSATVIQADVINGLATSANAVKDGGFEAGGGSWTASAGSYANTSTSPYRGNKMATWDASAASQTLTSAAVTVPEWLKGKNAVARCYFKAASGTATHTMGLWDGTTLTQATTIVSSTTSFVATAVNFVAPSSGTIAIRITSAADEVSISIDDCVIADAESLNISRVSQASLVASGYFATTASCTGWARAGTSLGAFATDADCPGPTVETNPGPGVLQTTDTDLPKFTVNNLPPGTYEVKMSGFYSAKSTTMFTTFAINDGTTTSGRSSDASANTTAPSETVIGYFTYTTAGNRTFELYASTSTGTVNIENEAGNRQLSFSIVRYPSASELVFNSVNSNFGWTSFTPNFTNWGTGPTGTCYKKRDGEDLLLQCNVVMGTSPPASEARVDLPDSLTSSANYTTLEVVGTFAQGGSIAGAFYTMIEPSKTYLTFSLQSAGAAALTKANASTILSASARASFSARVKINGWTSTNQNAPVLVNSITSVAAGALRLESARVASDGTVSGESGDWISGNCVVSSTSIYTCTLVSSLFVGSPNCVVTRENSGNSTSNPVEADISSASTSTVVVYTHAAESAAARAAPFQLMCMGSR
jgi:hypothetical protein